MRSRILVVGRDLDLRARLARMLSGAGYGVELADTAASAQRISAKGIRLAMAAIGREFAEELLCTVAELPPAVIRRALEGLVGAGLLLARGTAPHVSYAFKHALVQDAAYGSLLRAERRRLHGRVVASLSDGGATFGEAMPDLLAHHATEAGFYDKAAAWRLQAGLAALQRGAGANSICGSPAQKR